eukprot:scaffold2849_cov203-Alexandrium_tamarense.AAC.20
MTAQRFGGTPCHLQSAVQWMGGCDAGVPPSVVVEGVDMMLKEADGDDGRLMRRLMNRKGMQRVILVTMSTMYKLMSALEKPRPPKKGMSKSYQMSKSLPFRGVVKYNLRCVDLCMKGADQRWDLRFKELGDHTLN